MARRLKPPAGPTGPVALALESGGEHLAAALLRVPEAPGRPESEWRLLDEVTTLRGHQHADVMLGAIEQMLARQRLARSDLGLVAVGRGPGGFTGVRVAMATATGLSLGLGVPVWPVGSLEALALNAAGAPGLVVPLLDARKGEVYGGAWRVSVGGALEEVVAPRVALAEDVLAAAHEAAGGAPLHVFGSGALAYDCARGAPAHWHTLLGRQVGLLGLRAWEAAGRPAEGPPLDPAYLRKSEAEIAAERRGA